MKSKHIYKILYLILLSVLVITTSHIAKAQEGAYTIGYSSTRTSKSVTLSSGNVYLCEGASAGNTISSTSFTALVNNGKYAVVGYSSTNSCSITTTARGYTVGGVSVYNFTSYSYVTNTTSYTNANNKAVTVTWPNTITLTQPSSLYILISVGASTNNGAAISSVSLPSGCSQLFLTTSTTRSSVYAAYCKYLSAGTYTISSSISVGAKAGRTNNVMYGAFTAFIFPVFLFNITSSSSSLNIIPGQTGNVTLTLYNLTNANPLTVSLTCSTNSTAVGCYFSSSSVTPVGSTTLYINTTYSTSPGTYLVTVNGTASNNATNSTTITVTVPAESISISANPNPVNIIPGQSNTTTITASTNYGYNLNLSCIASNLSSYSCSFNPNSISSGSSSTLTITIPSYTISPGTYYVEIEAQDVNTGNYGLYNITVIIPAESINVNANPSSLTITPGGSGSSTITASDNYNYPLNLSVSCPSVLTCSLSSSQISSGGSATLTISTTSSTSGGTYTVTVTAKDANTGNSNSINVTVLIYQLNISVSPTSANVLSGQTTTVSVNANATNSTDYIQITCNAPSGIACSPTSTVIQSGQTTQFNITAPNVNSYTQYNITFIAKDLNVTMQNQAIFTLNVYPLPIIYITSPANNTQLSSYSISITFYTTYPNVTAQINGVNYTLSNIQAGYNTVSMYYNYGTNGLPGLNSILPNGGNLSIDLYVSSQFGSNQSGTYIYTIPPPIFNVNYVSPPTPSNGTVVNYWFAQIEGNVNNNLGGSSSCYLEVYNASSSSWVQLSMSSCSIALYNQYLQSLTYLSGSYYVLEYYIEAVNNQFNVTNSTPIYYLYISQNASNVTYISPATSGTISVTSSSSPYIVFGPYSYDVNIIVNINSSVTFVGSSGTVLNPYNIGEPVFEILSGNVTMNQLNINSLLYGIQLQSGTLTVENTNINSKIYGISTSGGTLIIKNSNINGNVAAISAQNTVLNITSSNINGQVWGLYLVNLNDSYISNSNVVASVFGLYLQGVTNSIFNNITSSAQVFVVYDSGGSNNVFSYLNTNGGVFGIYSVSTDETIENSIVNSPAVFGIYSTGANSTLIGDNVNGGLFSYYITGNAYNITSLGSKLGVYIYNSGSIQNLNVGTSVITFNYSGSWMINSGSGLPGTVGTYKFSGLAFSLIGSGLISGYFVNPPNATNYAVIGGIGSIMNVISNSTSFNITQLGTYGLYIS